MGGHISEDFDMEKQCCENAPIESTEPQSLESSPCESPSGNDPGSTADDLLLPVHSSSDDFHNFVNSVASSSWDSIASNFD